MPELPEVEVVRHGLARGVTGRRLREVEVHHPRAVRRHAQGPTDFADRLRGATITAVRRRGKYLWLVLDTDEAVLGHLGMSGQLLVVPPDSPDQIHLRLRFVFEPDVSRTGPDADRELRFVDQRTFGALAVADAGPPGTDPLAPGIVPPPIAHIAPDPLEPAFDPERVRLGLRRRRSGVKRALLDQTLVSGIGNIYADEALWRAGLHYARPTETLTRPEVARLLSAVDEVLREALAAGGTSFDALYVSAEGVSGLFERSLAVYGREGLPCSRCGAPVRREKFMNRSSHTCPHCQPRPRRGRW